MKEKKIFTRGGGGHMDASVGAFPGYDGVCFMCSRWCFCVCEENATEHIILILSQHESDNISILSPRALTPGTTQ